ncbi:hypothetical protein HDU99_000815 [Rhizoclosmatium hyalinum]|nr:hypothetical protein HDU99_000815 [Rhizoclosmatium hyalinum]
MPKELDSLIKPELFTSRIQDLNTILKPYANRRNYGPVFRFMTLILLGSITLAMYVMFGSEIFFIARIILVLGALKCVADLTFIQQDFEKDIISQLNTFNQEDRSIKLAWKLQPYGTEPFFNLAPVPFLRQIRVEYASKETECDEVLPNNVLKSANSVQAIMTFVVTLPNKTIHSDETQTSNSAVINQVPRVSPVIASIPLNLQHSESICIPTAIPEDLGSLIGFEQFTSRMQQLNDILKPHVNRRNYGPVFRYLTLISLGFITLGMYMMFGSEILFVARIILILGALKCVTDLTFIKQDFENAIISQLNSFNEEDESIRLVWTLQPYGTEPFFNLAPVPFLRQITIAYISKEIEVEELPEYHIEFTLFGSAAGPVALYYDLESGPPTYDEATR